MTTPETPNRDVLSPCPWCKVVPHKASRGAGRFIIPHEDGCWLQQYISILKPVDFMAWNTRTTTHHQQEIEKLREAGNLLRHAGPERSTALYEARQAWDTALDALNNAAKTNGGA
jgi:hypothetical protein